MTIRENLGPLYQEKVEGTVYSAMLYDKKEIKGLLDA